MVKVTDIRLNTVTKKATVSLFADTKSEVATATIEGLDPSYSVDAGSSVITANGELAFMKSDGTWNWIG